MIKDLLYCPLDLPPVPKDITLDNFSSFDTLKLPPTTLQNEKQAWKALMMRRALGGVSSYDNQLNFNLQWEWKPEIIQRAPNLIHWVHHNLPFKKTTVIAVLSSQKKINPHTDVQPHKQKEPINEFYRSWDPSMFRFLLDGVMIRNGFFVIRGGEKVYTELPPPSPGWAMSFDCIHGNDDPVCDQKILLYAMGEVDVPKHTELLNRSLEKYGQYAVYA